MNSLEDMDYRLELAEGFLKEAEEDYKSGRYRSCVDNSQISIENSAKAILAYFGPLAKTHNPSEDLTRLISEGQIAEPLKEKIKKLSLLAGQYGMKEHFLTDYGDEIKRISPWKLFSKADAKKANATALSSLEIAKEIRKFLLAKK